MRLTSEEQNELRIMHDALHEVGIELPNRDAQRFNDQDAGGGCMMFDLDSWYDEVVALYDGLA